MLPPFGVTGRPVLAESQASASGEVEGVPEFFHTVSQSAAAPVTEEKVTEPERVTAPEPIEETATSAVETTVGASTSS